MNRARTDGDLLQLALDIDPDVYPELHAALSALRSDATRGERLRQLAAAGLVWEKLRIRGHAALHGVAPDPASFTASLPASVPSSVVAPVASAPVPAPARSGRQSAGRPPAPRTGSPVAAGVMAPAPMPAGFVDLALDASPTHAGPLSTPTEPPAPADPVPPAFAPPLSAPWPPVLVDVVEPASFASAVPVGRRDGRRSRPMPLMAVPDPPAVTGAPDESPRVSTVAQMDPLDLAPAIAAAVVAGADATLGASADPPATPDDRADPLREPDPPVEHRSSTKSRLLRMKEKGLFRNG